jgi:D-alanine-D-alanine ligase
MPSSPTTTRVLILYNQPTLPADHPDAQSEWEVLETVAFVETALNEGGFRVERLGIGTDPAPLFQDLCRDRPDVVFNLYEGTAVHGDTEAYALGLLEWLRIPYTGCPSQAAVLARDKPCGKLLMKGAGLPTPAFFQVDSLPVPRCTLDWPVIIKPAREDASVGLDQGSVVTDQERANPRIELLLQRYGPPVLVEEYIDGRELNVSVIEHPHLRVLPVSEIVFAPTSGDRWPIVTYEAKWVPGSSDDLATRPRCPADLEPELADRVAELARRAFRLFGCRQYARVDMRLDRRNELHILEVNSNPDFHPEAGFARSLRAAGISHHRFTIDLVLQALQP